MMRYRVWWDKHTDKPHLNTSRPFEPLIFLLAHAWSYPNHLNPSLSSPLVPPLEQPIISFEQSLNALLCIATPSERSSWGLLSVTHLDGFHNQTEALREGAGAECPFLWLGCWGSPACHCTAVLLRVHVDEPLMGWLLFCDSPGNSQDRVPHRFPTLPLHLCAPLCVWRPLSSAITECALHFGWAAPWLHRVVFPFYVWLQMKEIQISHSNRCQTLEIHHVLHYFLGSWGHYPPLLVI